MLLNDIPAADLERLLAYARRRRRLFLLWTYDGWRRL